MSDAHRWVLPKTKDWSLFERMCGDILCEKYPSEFELYGRQGQKQYGIDIRDGCWVGGETVAQCKNWHEQSRAEDLADEIRKDLADAKAKFVIKKYIVMTALDRDTKAQDAIVALGEEQGVPIEAWFWDSIEEAIYGSETLREKYYRIFFGRTDPLDLIADGGAPAPVSYFQGRGDKIAEIEREIYDGAGRVLVGGIGGIGKSELCKYLFRRLSDGQGKKNGRVAWIEWRGSLKSSFAGKFFPGHGGEGATREGADLDGMYKAAIRGINKLARGLVLFIDNMNDVPDEDRRELNGLACGIVATSRLGEMPTFKTVNIDELSEDDCAKIYSEVRGGGQRDNGAVGNIIEKAGRLTIVVELLAKTAKKAKLTDAELLEKLDAGGFDLSDISEKVDGDKRFNERMQALFDVSPLSDAERAVLRIFSLFPSLDMPGWQAKKWLALESLDILNSLANAGWLKETEFGYSMHQVVSGVVQYDNKPTYKECSGLIDAIAEDLSYEDTEIFTSRLGVLPFGESVVDYFAGVEEENVASLLSWVGRLCYEQGEYGKALEYFGLALVVWEKVLGREHPSTAATYNNMAVVYNDQGEYGKALEYHGLALAVWEKVLGREHLDTAATYNNMAVVYKEQGEYGKALEYHGLALAVKEKVLGREHPSTAATYNNMANVYRDQGEYGKALEYHGLALSVREKVLGREHPDTAATYNNMATVYRDQGEYGKALEYHGLALSVREKVLGREHPSTAMTYNNMAVVYRDQGEYGKALEYFLPAYRVFLAVFGGEHRNTKIVFNGLINAYFKLNPGRGETDFMGWLGEQ